MHDVFDPYALVYIVPILIGTLALSKQCLYGILDPLLIAFFSLSAALGLLIYYTFDLKLISEYTVVAQFTLFHLTLLAGLWLGNKSHLPRRGQTAEPGRGKMFIIASISIITLCGYFVYAHLQTGIQFFDIDNEVQKYRIFSEGGGLLRRAISPWSSFSFFNILYLFSRGYISRAPLTILTALLVVITWSSGGKASLLNLFIVFIYSHIFLRHNHMAIKTIKLKWAAAAIAVAITAQVLYLFTRFDRESTRHVGVASDFKSSWSDVVKRVIASGDFSLYYITSGIHGTDTKHWKDFFKSVNGGLLGPFRLAPYQRTLGAEIIESSLQISNEKDTGPNAMAPFVASIYFGPVGGAFAIFLVGLALGYTRKRLLGSLSRDYYGAAFFVMINSIVYLILIDYTLFLMYLHSILLILAILTLLKNFEHRPNGRNASETQTCRDRPLSA